MRSKPGFYRSLVLALLLLTGCAGETARPVVVQQHGDAQLSCHELEQALDQIWSELSARLLHSDPAGTATGEGVADIFLLEPVRYRELDKSEQNAINALIRRYNHLIGIGREKECHCERRRLPEFG